MIDKHLQFFPVADSGAWVSINFIKQAFKVGRELKIDDFLLLDDFADGQLYYTPPSGTPLPVIVYDEREWQ